MTDTKLNGAAKPDEGEAVLVRVGAGWMAGLIASDTMASWGAVIPSQIELYSPHEYQGAVQLTRSAEVRDATDINAMKQCVPVAGLGSIRKMTVRPDCIPIRIDELPQREREAVMRAIAQCEAIVQEMRRQSSVIAKPRLIVPGS
jgi:hypothetical protein